MKNKQNLQFFEAPSMKSLYKNMQEWQVKNNKRLLSTDIQQDGDMFTCIALTNPSEVVLCNLNGENLDWDYAGDSRYATLNVRIV
jgi:hypothetical protein